MKRFFLYLFLSMISFQVFSQGNKKKSPSIVPAFTLEGIFNHQDFLLGTGLGAEDLENHWGAKLNFTFRPSYKKVEVEQALDLIHQYREKVFGITLDLEKRFWFTQTSDEQMIGAYAGIRGGYMTGNYRGVNDYPESGFIYSPGAGAAFRFKDGIAKAGYMYMSSPLKGHYIMVSVTMLLIDK
jgi:hypothetical protein